MRAEHFMAPELLENHDFLIDVDQFHLFAIDVAGYASFLYLMFSIDLKLKKYKPYQFMDVIKNFQSMLLKPDSIPEHYWNLIQKCMDNDISKRPSFEEITEILKNDKYAIEEFGMKTNLEQLHEYQNRIDRY